MNQTSFTKKPLILLKIKISFELSYNRPIIESKSGRLIKIENINDLDLNLENDLEINHLDLVYQNLDIIDELDELDEIMHENAGKNNQEHVFDGQDLLRNAIGKATISLAQTAFNPNMILNENDDKIFKKNNLENLIVNNREQEELKNQKNLKNYLHSSLYANMNKKSNSWQIRVNIIELKYLHGNNENVYCLVEIGDQSFKTSVKKIDFLKFNEVCVC